jgi:hypothetical protein
MPGANRTGCDARSRRCRRPQGQNGLYRLISIGQSISVKSPFHENSKRFLALSINLIVVSRLVASALPAQVSL